MTTARAETPLVERVRARLAAHGTVASRSAVAAAVREEAGLLGDAAVLEVTEALRLELMGAGPLEEFLRDPATTDVLVNGPGEVWVDRGDGLERVAVRFPDEAAVRRLAVRLAATGGRRLDDASPWVDARLRSGVRLHAVLPPISPTGTIVSLRVPPQRAFVLSDMVARGALDDDMAAVLRALVAARLAFLVTGGTGSGKTTLLSTLLGLVPPSERLVLVEDSGELRPAHPHVVRLEARSANAEGAGVASLRDLVRQALRMRPDRLVVGEVRGAEVVDLFAALNTGHEGSCGTLHANSPAEVPARVEALGALAGLDARAVGAQLAAAVDAVVHLRRRGARRSVDSVSLVRRRQGRIVVVPAFTAAGPTAAGAELKSLLERAAR